MMRDNQTHTFNNKEELNTLIVFLADEKYGYGYTYTTHDDDKPYRSFSAQDRFTKEDMLDDIDNLIGEENRKVHIGVHETAESAVTSLLDYWYIDDSVRGHFVPNITTTSQAIRIGKRLGLEYIIY